MSEIYVLREFISNKIHFLFYLFFLENIINFISNIRIIKNSKNHSKTYSVLLGKYFNNISPTSNVYIFNLF